MKSIAIDFGGSSIKMVLFQDGKISKRRTIPAYSHKGLAPRLADTEAAVRGMLEGEELIGAKRVLRAAALTYIAGLLVAVANLVRLIALSNRRR